MRGAAQIFQDNSAFPRKRRNSSARRSHNQMHET